jgi:tetratricopeptide (TPR) repeat protein
MRQPDRAIAIYQEVLKRSPAVEKALVYTRIGVALREKDDHPNSAKWLAQAIAEPRTSERSVIVARLELGKTLDLLGQRQEALKQYQTVVKSADIAGSQKEAAELLQHAYSGNRKSSD